MGEDANATKEKIERAMEIFAANAKLGGVDVDSVTVNDPELGMLENDNERKQKIKHHHQEQIGHVVTSRVTPYSASLSLHASRSPQLSISC